MCDNTATIQFGRDPKFHKKSMHIKRRYYFVRNGVKYKEIVIKYISTNRIMAEPLTKRIPRDAFKVHVASLGLRRTWFLDMYMFDCMMDMLFLY